MGWTLFVPPDGFGGSRGLTQAQSLQALHELSRKGMRPGIEVTRELLARLGDPQRSLRVVHVAGTNGKGSTCRYAHALFQACGMRSGLFTSPHLVSVRERFVVDDHAISTEHFEALLERVLRLASQVDATYFEALTAVACLWFSECRLDVCVVETGLGGRLDSTHVLPADVSVITQVGLDHQELLGHTVEAIWREKIDILREHGTIVTAETRPNLMLELAALALERHGKILPVPPIEVPPEIPAGPATKNWQLAIAAVSSILGRTPSPVEQESAAKGLRWPGRREQLDVPRVLLDVAHNPDAVRALVQDLGSSAPELVFACMADKNWHEMAELLRPVVAGIHLPRLHTPRALPPEQLLAEFPTAQVYEGVADALEGALQACASRDGLVLVCGSFHTVGAAQIELWRKGRYSFWPHGIEPDPELPAQG